jgi:hypothetical protein
MSTDRQIRCWYDADTRQWVAYYHRLQVTGCGRDKAAAQVSCIQAIRLWVESCAARGTTAAAWAECADEGENDDR